jgi:hypothetical protein
VYLFKRKLTLREVHKLYFLLKPFLPEKEEEFLIHEVIKIMESISPEVFTKAMVILHGSKFNFKRNPGELALKFVEGLKESGLFAYVGFVKSLHG